MATVNVVSPSSEDWIAFISSLLSGTSSAIGNNPSFMVYGLVIAAVGKALPSLGQKDGWKHTEDWLLFGSAVAGFLATSLSGKIEYAVWGVIFGMISKAIPSLIDAEKNKNERLEDVISLVIVAIGGIIYYLQTYMLHADSTYATLVIALGIISKALPSLQGKNTQPPPENAN